MERVDGEVGFRRRLEGMCGDADLRCKMGDRTYWISGKMVALSQNVGCAWDYDHTMLISPRSTLVLMQMICKLPINGNLMRCKCDLPFCN